MRQSWYFLLPLTLTFLACPAEQSTSELGDSSVDAFVCPENEPSGPCVGSGVCRYGHGPSCYPVDHGAVSCKCSNGRWSCSIVHYDCPAQDVVE